MDKWISISRISLILFACSIARPCWAQEQDVVDYATTQSHDPAARLEQRIEKGAVKLSWDDKLGYLPSLLKALRIPESSQMLVFSKTSFQRNRISPHNPRALYFRDDVYVGYVNGGEVLEVSAVDPKLGAVFYTLPQKKDKARLGRMGDECMICHEGNLTENVPGHMVRSVYSDLFGQPILSAGTTRVTHSTPIHDRWGGWYVTGKSGRQVHMGNQVADEDKPEALDRAKGTNIVDVSGRFDASGYLRPTSDIVALMVLEHQTQMDNLITKAGYGVMAALRDQKVMNQALGRPADFVSESTPGRIKSACEPLVKYMLFADEVKLTDPIEGVSGFTQEFSQEGPRDGKGRCLRELDLKTRLFKYPCSYMIYSESFEGLPKLAKEYIYQRLWEILTGQDQSRPYARLSVEDRAAVREILKETKRDLPVYWK
jgi:hypothetical protein